MSDKHESNIPWWLIVLGFIFFWPAGMVLLFLSLGGVSLPFGAAKEQAAAAARKVADEAAAAARTAQQGQTAQGHTAQASTAQASTAQRSTAQRSTVHRAATAQAPKRRVFRAPKGGTAFTIAGAVTTFIFLTGLLDEWLTFGFYFVDDWFPLLGFTLAGVALLVTGLKRTRTARRQRLYFGIIGQRNWVYLSDLAGTAGVSEKQVVADVQKMLADGILPMGYIDRTNGRLVFSDKGYEPPKPQPKGAKAQQEATGDEAVLRQIRQVNDAIADEVMSQKIDRIEEITGKILDFQRKNPAKAGQLRQFLNYYLPTTLKILNAYAQMEAQGINGENITAAKTRIEGMMDKVVEGFEKQLDQLFHSEAMDIATDVEVLERMLDKDGLGQGMTMQ